ncbi:acyltransferase [Polynucleobacter sp. AM-25C3]|uniref:acyltransferase family protein n=1 Tax=Polynucleobacter sp. AM-25C3 TaxID=1855569 RepID=UPI001C0AA109|nr:acyltransferase [Polynucleobacter sp. AM-25C3]MBU3601786.1 acyltransferase [Polynucleobacter sp. AM-25C3]
MKYRPEIDGLRALAVIPVILFHAGFNYFSGGFVGVDVFFVISGYLITTIILAELEESKFSIINFYERRARRILPVLFFVMAVCIPFAWILLPPFELASFSKSLIAVPLFLSNFFFWREGGYFETAAELKPLLHTWSLAVEEQYYVFFPIFLMLCWRLGRRWVLGAIILIAIVSLISAQIGSIYKPVPNFFLLPTRAWELAIGASAVFYISNRNIMMLTSLARQILSGLGFLLITTSIFVFNKDTPFPSIYALVPTIGTVLILLFALPDTLVGKVLGSRLLVFIGLISYSAYLWHQPIFAFSRYYFNSISGTLMVILVIITLLLSVITWRYIERPFRDRTQISRKTIFIVSLALSLIFITFGYFSCRLFGSSSNFGVEARIAKELSTANAVYSSNMDERKFIKYRIQFENLSVDSVVLGSSRVMQIGEHNYRDKIINLGVSGSSIEDDIAIADMAIKKFKPSTIFIGADPWLFNSKSGQGRWRSLNNEYISALSSLKLSTTSIANLTDNNKQSRFFTVASKIYDAVNLQKFNAINDIPESRDKIRRDGSRVYNLAYANKNQKEISSEFNDLLNYAMTDYDYSKESQEIFGRFIDAYSKNHNVVLVLSPYHPDLYERMKIERPIYLEIEANFRDFSKLHGVKIIGSYNPYIVGCNSTDFYDGMHPKEACMARIMKEFKGLD